MEQSVTCGDMYQIPISSAVAVTLKTHRFLSLKKYNIKFISLFKFGVFCAVFALCFCIGVSLVLLRPGGLEGRFNKSTSSSRISSCIIASVVVLPVVSSCGAATLLLLISKATTCRLMVEWLCCTDHNCCSIRCYVS